jgi:choline dehydrogenase
MVEAMRYMETLLHQGPAAEYYGPLLQPDPDDDWGLFARRTFDSYHHGAGTCRMGPASDPLAVVDAKLRVHGLDNLWIGDASIMPTVARANTNFTSIMIGERLADFVARAG